MRGKHVLEVGLGYGTVSQKIAESGVLSYTGLDIAMGPVNLVNQRLQNKDLNSRAIVGNILEPPFSSESFDVIIAIGCLHHTGNLPLAISNCHRLLRKGGLMVFMVYNAYSYRRWRTAPVSTLRLWFNQTSGLHTSIPGDISNRAAYDTNALGDAAPHTDFTTSQTLRSYCQKFKDFSYQLENIDRDIPFVFSNRNRLLKSIWPRVVGLDIYVTVSK